MTANSVYSQLPSILRCHLPYPQPEDAPCRGDKDPYNMDSVQNKPNLTSVVTQCDLSCFTYFIGLDIRLLQI